MEAYKTELVTKIQRALADRKKYDVVARYEHNIAFNTNNARGRLGREHLKVAFPRMDRWDASFNNIPCGASKQTFLRFNCPYDGQDYDFQNIVVKVNHYRPYFDEHCHASDTTIFTGNQIRDEFLAWQELARTKDGDLFCPVFRAYFQQGDKIDYCSERYCDDSYLISMRAEHINQLDRCGAYVAQKYGDTEGRKALHDIRRIKELASRMNWRDVTGNGGNCGVIYDCIEKRHRVVMVDYGL